MDRKHKPSCSRAGFQDPTGLPNQHSTRNTEQLLMAQLHDKSKDPRAVWRRLITLYRDSARYDEAVIGLRNLMALEPCLEEKAACVLAMGGTAEKQGNYQAAVQFYREALAMEPMRSDVWYFIHNNLGFSLNMLGHFIDGEQFCRTAIDIDPRRSNAHKNLGLALQGQNRYCEAASAFVRGTEACPSDSRASQLLRRLLTEHKELELEFGAQAGRCEAAVRFAQWAVHRALSGNILKVVLACNEFILDDLIAVPLERITAGAVHTVTAGSWIELLRAMPPGQCDMVFVVPRNMRGGAPWSSAGRYLRAIKARGTKTLVVVGTAGELARRGEACRQAGGDEFLELPLMDSIEDTLRCWLTGSDGPDLFEDGTGED
jgi:tetratricopeptide (TPR) repeat protein